LKDVRIPKVPDHVTGGKMATIALVDDDRDVLALLATMLESEGYDVVTYLDGSTALDGFKRVRPDLAILDIRMPKMNGFELYREMRKVDGSAAVCFLTAFDVHKEEFEKMFPGVQVKAFLRKPITIESLVTRLNELVPQ